MSASEILLTDDSHSEVELPKAVHSVIFQRVLCHIRFWSQVEQGLLEVH